MLVTHLIPSHLYLSQGGMSRVKSLWRLFYFAVSHQTITLTNSRSVKWRSSVPPQAWCSRVVARFRTILQLDDDFGYGGYGGYDSYGGYGDYYGHGDFDHDYGHHEAGGAVEAEGEVATETGDVAVPEPKSEQEQEAKEGQATRVKNSPIIVDKSEEGEIEESEDVKDTEKIEQEQAFKVR